MRIGFLAIAMLVSGCLSHPPPPAAPYHAVDNGERWHLIIDDKHVTFLPAGGQPVREPKPQVINGVAGEIYQAGRIDVNIVHAQCSANGRAFPDRVQVTVDGVRHEGCGGL